MVSGEGGDNETMDLAAILAEVLDVLEETEVIAMEIAATTTVIGGDDESTIDYVIPDRMVVTMEPREEVSLTLFCPSHIHIWSSHCQTGHLVHVKLTIYDADGEPVRNLGLVNPWMCQASLTHREKLPQNEYATSSLFHA